MISIQTNVTSLIAQQDLNVNTNAESNTIEQLSSGYRINSSGDDAAGLAVANQYEADIQQLTQGVQNANNGVSTLQIIDGGLSNISQILNRLETLATESASGTFTGDRTTLNNEYQSDLQEITRQAANIGLNAGGQFNNNLNVYIGGGELSTLAGTSEVNIDLGGVQNAVDASSLGLTNTNILGGTVGGVEFSGNTVALDNPNTEFLATDGTQTYTFNYTDADGNAQSRTVTLSGGTDGISGSQVIQDLNNGLTGTGITASTDANTGVVQFTSAGAFTVGAATASAGNSTVTAAANAVNTSQYNVQSTADAYQGATDELSAADTFTLTQGSLSANISLAADDSVATDVTAINTALQSAGITGVTALATGNGEGISIQGSQAFNVVDTTAVAPAATSPFFGATLTDNAADIAAPTGGATAGTNATAAIAAIANAVQALGLVQGAVGTGENKLNFAINLAQSQISSFSAAESSIKDVNVASAASNLSSEQILQQSSVAALVQANAIPEAVLSLLKSGS